MDSFGTNFDINNYNNKSNPTVEVEGHHAQEGVKGIQTQTKISM